MAIPPTDVAECTGPRCERLEGVPPDTPAPVSKRIGYKRMQWHQQGAHAYPDECVERRMQKIATAGPARVAPHLLGVPAPIGELFVPQGTECGGSGMVHPGVRHLNDGNVWV